MTYRNFLLFLSIISSFVLHSQEIKKAGLDSANALFYSGQYDQAVDLGREYLSELSGNEDSILLEKAKTYNLFASIFYHKSINDSAHYYVLKSMELLNASHQEDIEMAHSYLIRSMVEQREGQPKEALKHIQEAIRIVKLQDEEKQKEELTEPYHVMAIIYDNLGQHDSAVYHLENAIKLSKTLSSVDHSELGNMYNTLGTFYYRKKQLKKVTECFDLALKEYLKVLPSDHINIGILYGNLATLYLELSEFDRALDHNERAIEITSSNYGEDNLTMITLLNNRGRLYSRLGDNNQAISYHQKTLDILERSFETHYFTPYVHLAVAEAYLKENQFTQAKKNYLKALKRQTALSGKIHDNVVESYWGLGRMHFQKKEYQEALSTYQDAMEILDELWDKDSPRFSHPHVLLAGVYIKLNKLEDARKHLHKARQFANYSTYGDFRRIPLFQQIPGLLQREIEFFDHSFKQTQDQVYQDSLNLLYREAFDFFDFLLYEQAEKTNRQHSIVGALRFYEAYISEFLLPEKRYEEIFELIQKSKGSLLANKINTQNITAFHDVPAELLSYEEKLDLELSAAMRLLYEQEGLVKDSIELLEKSVYQLKEQKRHLIDSIRTNFSQYYYLKYDKPTVSIAEIRSHLKAKDAYLEYFVGDSSIFILVIDNDGCVVKQIDKTFPLKSWVSKLRNSIYSFWLSNDQRDSIYESNLEVFKEFSHSLYQKLVEPVDSFLPERLIVVSDGIVGYLPFEILLKNSAAQVEDFHDLNFLLREYIISYGYSASSWLRANDRENKKNSSGLIAFAPSFLGDSTAERDIKSLRQGLGQLAHNHDEASYVADLFRGTLFEGSLATKSSFINEMGNYSIVHLSTHGKADDHLGEYSYIAFYHDDSKPQDFKLHVNEIYNLDINADLFVLSACETGLGELKRGEGVISLNHGLSYAGARSTLTSLWSVNDAQAADLIKAFYENLNEGMRKDEALREAKLELISAGAVDPFFWAPFIISGNMAPLDQSSTSPLIFIMVGLLVLFLIVWQVKRA